MTLASIERNKAGGVVEVPQGVFTFDHLDLSGARNLTVRGAGREVTVLRPTSTTGWAVDLTDSRNVTFEGLSFVPTTQERVEGGMFGGMGATDLTWEGVRIAAFWRGLDFAASTDFKLRGVRFTDYGNAPWEYGIHLDTCPSLFAEHVLFATSIQQGAVAYRLVDSDTVTMLRCGAQKFGQSNIGGLEIVRGQWHHYDALLMECGTRGGHAVSVIGAAYGIDFTACHLVTSLTGLHTEALNGEGPRAVRMTGGRSCFNGTHGIHVEAGSAELVGVDVSNNSVQESGVYDGIRNDGSGTVRALNCRVGTYMITPAGGGKRHAQGLRNVTNVGTMVTDEPA